MTKPGTAGSEETEGLVLRVQHPQVGERTLEVEVGADGVTVGRSKNSASVVFDWDPQVSRAHARLWVSGDQVWFEDLGSSNGSWLGEQKLIGPRTFEPGHAFRVGETLLTFVETRPRLVVQREADVRDANLENLLPERSPHSGRITALYELSQQLLGSTRRDVLAAALDRVFQAVPAARRIFLVEWPPRDGERLNFLAPPRVRDAQATGTTGISRTLLGLAAQRRHALFFTDDKPLADSGMSLLNHGIRTAVYVPLLAGDEVIAILCVDNPEPDRFMQMDGDDFEFLRAVGALVGSALSAERMREHLKRVEMSLNNLAMQFSPDLRQRMLNQATPLRPGGQLVHATILFADVRGFSAFSEQSASWEVMEGLNRFLTRMVEVIFKHDGSVEKYIGDAIVASFGAVEPDPHHSFKAVQAAVEMQDVMKQWSEFQIGIGIHCGQLTAGFLGSQDRLQFAVIGNATNIASRICSEAGGGEVLISFDIWNQVQDRFECGSPREFAAKNIQEKQWIYPVVGPSAPRPA